MDPTQWNVPYPLVVSALFVIVMVRANGTYWLGRLASAGARHTRLARLMDSPGYLRATRRIDAYGAPVVTFSFLTVGFQTVANLAAGATRMSLRHYFPAVAVGSVVWAFLYATLGTVGVDLLGELYHYSPVLAIGLAVGVVAVTAAAVIWQSRRRAVAQDSDSTAA
ncbi:MAG: VTT domain-containing protein [Propionicimonas sp.]